MLGFFFWLFLVLFVFVSLFLVLLILIQKGRGGGLSASFGGGGGGSGSAFGAKTGDVLTWVTSISFGIFLLLAIGLNLVANARQKAADDALGKTTASNVIDAGGTAPGSPLPPPATPK